jgi:transposase
MDSGALLGYVLRLMWRDLGISEQEWERTPQSVRTLLLALQQQVRLMGIRFTAYEKQIASLREQVAQVDDLKAEINELKERLGRNSSNSSKPPSSDPPTYKAKPPSESQGCKRGGQPGHQGSSRKLIPMEEVNHLVELRPANCLGCGHRLRGDDPHPERHQVAEVPPVKIEVTEYRRHSLRCRACGSMTQAEWPLEMPRGAFGPRAQAITAYLTGRLGASHRDVVEAMKVLYGLEMSTGSVTTLQRQVSEALAVVVDAASHFVRQQKSQYVDETSWRQSRQLKWLWVNATAEVTAFKILEGRSQTNAKQVINESAKGVVTTDRHWSYNWLSLRRRQICWAHLARDFQAMVERSGESVRLGQALLKQVKRLFALWHKVRAGSLRREQLRSAMKSVQRRVKKLLEAGAHCEHKKTRRTCANILKVEKALWTFVRMEAVEPTNNGAERALRRAVLWRKKSFGTQSTAGSRFVERILTVVTTQRQQNRDVLEYLTEACHKALSGEVLRGLHPNSS